MNINMNMLKKTSTTYESGREAGTKATQFSAGLLVGIGTTCVSLPLRILKKMGSRLGFLVLEPVRSIGQLLAGSAHLEAGRAKRY